MYTYFSLFKILKDKAKKSENYLNFKRNRLNFCLFLCLFISLALFINPSYSEEKTPIKPEEIALFNENTLLPIAPNPELKVVKKLFVVVTAYSSTPWETWDDPFITAAGTKVKEGIVANNYLPFGTKIRMPELFGDKIFIVEDRLNSRKGYYHVDIWFPSYWQAKEFGAKNTYIEVLGS